MRLCVLPHKVYAMKFMLLLWWRMIFCLLIFMVFRLPWPSAVVALPSSSFLVAAQLCSLMSWRKISKEANTKKNTVIVNNNTFTALPSKPIKLGPPCALYNIVNKRSLIRCDSMLRCWLWLAVVMGALLLWRTLVVIIPESAYNWIQYHLSCYIST